VVSKVTLPEVHIEMIAGVLRVYEEGGSFEKHSPYSAMMIVVPHYSDPKGCIIEGAIGSLSKNTNIMIGLKLIEHGYAHLYHKVAEGGKSTSHSKLVETKDGFDYYFTDLIAERKRLLGLPDVK
jgi:hypothetical protein